MELEKSHVSPRKSHSVHDEEADLIRKELAVLKSRVETIHQAVETASLRSDADSTDQVTSSLRELSEPRTPASLKSLANALNYTLWFLALAWLVKQIVHRFRKS